MARAVPGKLESESTRATKACGIRPRKIRSASVGEIGCASARSSASANGQNVPKTTNAQRSPHSVARKLVTGCRITAHLNLNHPMSANGRAKREFTTHANLRHASGESDMAGAAFVGL